MIVRPLIRSVGLKAATVSSSASLTRSPDRHLLPLLGPRLIRQITTADVAELLDGVREQGCSEKTVAGALATLASVMGFAVRNGWIADNPVTRLERHERRTRPVASSGYSAARRSPGSSPRACRPTGR